MCVEWIIMNPGACMVVCDRTHRNCLQFANLYLILLYGVGENNKKDGQKVVQLYFQ